MDGPDLGGFDADADGNDERSMASASDQRADTEPIAASPGTELLFRRNKHPSSGQGGDAPLVPSACLAA